VGRSPDALKTREFATDGAVAALVRAFEYATIQAFEFTHAAQIAVALSYPETSSPEQALERMRKKLKTTRSLFANALPMRSV
jgi:hypothetical protein